MEPAHQYLLVPLGSPQLLASGALPERRFAEEVKERARVTGRNAANDREALTSRSSTPITQCTCLCQ